MDYLQAARQKVAELYRYGSVVYRGILGGQWDNGSIIQNAIKEIRESQVK